MDLLARRRALAAAAKVALSFTFLTACGGTATRSGPDSEGNAAPGNETDDPLHTSPARLCDASDDGGGSGDANGAGNQASDASGDALTATSCALPAADAGLSVEARTCCVDLVSSRMSSDAGWPQLDRSALADEMVSACCTALADGQWDGHVKDQRESVAVLGCCGADANISPTCTPWGPPMPPRMPAARAQNPALLEVA